MPDTILEEIKQSHTHTQTYNIPCLLWGVKYKDIKKTSQRVMSGVFIKYKLYYILIGLPL